jgi:hypothetical protein
MEDAIYTAETHHTNLLLNFLQSAKSNVEELNADRPVEWKWIGLLPAARLRGIRYGTFM